MAECDAGLKDHYVTIIKKKTNAASKPAVKQLIEDAIKQMNSEQDSDVEHTAKEPIDPEVAELAENIARDPLLFKKRIDLVNQLGVIGERKNIGLNFLVMESCLLPMGVVGSEALALKNSGRYGAGKSFPLFMCLKLYPKSAYHLITSGSDKSLYHIQGGLKHKALILAEALALESSGRGDNELAYAIRSLVSEGRLKYQYTGFKGKEKVTIVKKMEGPTSLLTTTIRGKLEDQLEDRLITMHPNISAEQTHNIIERTAELASGDIDPVDEKTISAWKLFNQSLVPVEVVISYSKDIASFVGRNRSLPIAVRRAFKRILSAVKTIALMYQKQRSRDDLGRVIAEFSDYSIAVQLINDSFMESIGEGKRYTDERIKIIDKHGVIAPKDLAEVAGVSGAAISQWMKTWIEKGVITWCDEESEEFPDVKLLEKAKRSGKAFIKVADHNRLPTTFELTGNPDWDNEGELYQQYDLGIESIDTDILDLNEGEQSSFSLNTSADSYDVENKEELDPNEAGMINFFDGLDKIFAKGNVSAIN
jgi:hypothetical protein